MDGTQFLDNVALMACQMFGFAAVGLLLFDFVLGKIRDAVGAV